MTSIYKNNGRLRVILSFTEKGQFRSKKPFSQPTSQCVSQLRIECHCAAKWHTCAKIAFAIAKYPAGWNFGCEIRDFHALLLRSCELGAPVLRSGTRVPNLTSQLRKFSQRIPMSSGMVWQQSAYFAKDFLRLRSLVEPCFCSVFAPISSFQFLFNFFHLRSFKKIKTHIKT